MKLENLFLEVITPESLSYTGAVKSVTVPGSSGGFQILFNHAPIISALDIGIVKIVETDGKEKLYSTGGGTIEVLNNKIIIVADSFEAPDDIDATRAEKAKERALDRLKKSHKEKIDEVRADLALKRAVNRLKLVTKF